MANHPKDTSQYWYCPVRRCDGRDWFDISDISSIMCVAKDNAARSDKKCPNWAARNQLVRIAKVRIKEVGKK